ncbi:Isochorismatase hydrolase [Hypoxylon cercidicola]|nr:Isochorismatase hydrolase [Hypoxylon cercidicola]
MATFAATFNTADKTAPGHYGPSQTALLLLDFHSMFVYKYGGSSARAALKVAATMRTWAKSMGIQVIHCLMDTDAVPFPTCKDIDLYTSIVASMKFNDGEEPPEILEGTGDDVTFTRRPGYVSALKSPGLDDFLRQKGIKSLVCTGLSTSGCVMRTTAAAADAEFVTTVISDACADTDESVHDWMLAKVLTNRGYVVTAAEFQDGFSKANSGK